MAPPRRPARLASPVLAVGLAVGWVVALAAACAGPPRKIGSRAPEPDVRTASSRTPSSGRTSSTGDGAVRPARVTEVQSLVFAPSSDAVTAYNDPPYLEAPSTPLGDAIVAAIEQFHAASGGVAPRADGRLFAAATELASVVPEDAPLAYPLIEFALQRHGIIEPSPHIVVIWGPLDQPRSIMDKLAERLPEILASETFARVGVGTAVRKEDGEGAAILALQSSHITTKPIPRQLPSGGTIRLEGKVHGAYRQPAVFVTREDGSVKRATLTKARSGRFRTAVSCRGRRGRQQIEITAIDASGSSVLANFPVWCNARAPSSVTVQPSLDNVLSVDTPEQAEAIMLDLVNRDRAKHGLPPLARAGDVDRVARGHSQEMKDTGVVAHVSQTTGSAADRVKAAGIRTAVVLENVARAYGVGEAQAGLMNSPGHRANLLSDVVTHIGIGIVFGELMAGRREMFVTQVFTRVPPRIDSRQARKAMYDKIAPHRLTEDPQIGALAQRYAAALASGTAQDVAAREASKKLAPFARRYVRVTSAVTTVADIEAFDEDTVFSDKRVTHYGLGVAQGNHAELGDNAIYIVILLAQAR